MINVYQPSLGEEELKAISRVFDSNWIGKGQLVTEFEEKFSEHVNVGKDHLLSTNCCTEGLFSSMHLMDIKPGDEVIIPTISFVGAANAVCANGSKLILCDVDKRSLNAGAEDIEKVITPKTKAVILLHYGGIPCNMDEIMDLCGAHGIKVIEDGAAGVCSSYKGKALGTIGDMGMWSFDAMKILVCGDGAMLHFKHPEIRERAEKWLYFGLEAKSGYENSVAQKWWEFNISSFGHRAIMNNVNAAMAIEQLKKLPIFMEKRKAVHEFYEKELEQYDWMMRPLPIPDDWQTSYYFYHIQVLNGKRDKLAAYLRQNGIYTTYRYYPIHKVKGYGVTGIFPNADWATDNTLLLPIHQSISDEELDMIAGRIKEFNNNYC